MALKRLRQYLPVTKVDLMRHKRDGWIRRIDVASAIFKCILQDRLKYIQGDYPVEDVFQRYLKLCGSVGVMSLRVFSPPPRATSRPHSLVRI